MRRQIRGKWVILLVVSLLAAAQLSSCGRKSASSKNSGNGGDPAQVRRVLSEPTEWNPGSYECKVSTVRDENVNDRRTEVVKVDKNGQTIYKSCRYEATVSDDLPIGSTEEVWYVRDDLGRVVYKETLRTTDEGIAEGYPRATVYAYDGDTKRETLRRTVDADGYVLEHTERKYDTYGNLIFRKELNRNGRLETTAELNERSLELYRIVDNNTESSGQYPTRALESERIYNADGLMEQQRNYQCDAETGWTPVLTERYKYKYFDNFDYCERIDVYDGGLYSLPHAAVLFEYCIFDPRLGWAGDYPFVEDAESMSEYELMNTRVPTGVIKNYCRVEDGDTYNCEASCIYLCDYQNGDRSPFEYDPEEKTALIDDNLEQFTERGLFSADIVHPELEDDPWPYFYRVKYHLDGTRASLKYKTPNWIEEREYDEHGNLTEIRMSTSEYREIMREEYRYTYY